MILVVEDDAIQRQNLEALLKDAGFQTLSAENAETALVLLNAHKDIRTIVLDVQMPGPLDGIDVLLAVRSRWPAIKVIIVSGLANREQLPADVPLLVKPYTGETMLAIVRQMLGITLHASAIRPWKSNAVTSQQAQTPADDLTGEPPVLDQPAIRYQSDVAAGPR
jgi:DNA-binding NtrC family response regulator